MQSNAQLQAFASTVESHAAQQGNVIGEGTFLRLVFGLFRDFAHQQIDTEAERDAIKDFLLALADKFVAPKFPIGWQFARNGIDATLDSGLDRVAEFLEPEPA